MIRKASAATKQHISAKRLLFLVLPLVALYVLLPQLSSFHKTFSLLHHVSGRDVGLSLLFTLLSYAAATYNYLLLSFRLLRFNRTFIVQLAAMLMNRLLPAGAGAIGANFAYLRKSRHSSIQAASVVAANNTLGIIGHFTLLGLLLVVFHSQLASIHLMGSIDRAAWIVGAAVSVLVVLAVSIGRIRHWLLKSLVGIGTQLRTYSQRPERIVGALLSSMSLTLCNIASFYWAIAALDLHVSFVAVMLVFTLGFSLGAAVPTPGGLGGVEAGLVAGLVAYHVTSPEALAAALLYRFISFWLPLVLGVPAFIIASRRSYF